MKTAHMNHARFMNAPIVRVPNAASRRQVFHKILDTLLICASGAGIGATALLLLALG